MRQVLDVSVQAIRQRLSLLRRRGIARTVTLHDPVALGGAYQSTIWIRMAQMTPTVMERFESQLQDDAYVISAQRIAGDCDYRLSCFHGGYGHAARWVRALRCRPEIAEVRQMPTRHLFGHELMGIVLWERAHPFVRQEGRQSVD